MSCSSTASAAIATLGASLPAEARARLQAAYDLPPRLRDGEERDTLTRAAKALLLRLRATGAALPDHLDPHRPGSRAALRFGRLSLALAAEERAAHASPPPPTRDRLAQTSFNGRRSVSLLRGPRSEAAVQAAIQRIVGRPVSLRELAALTGAPDDADVQIGVPPNGDLMLIVYHPLYQDTQTGELQPSVRRLVRDGEKLVLINQSLSLADDAPAGMGTHIFASQVAAARALGVAEIRLHAARYEAGDDDDENAAPREYQGYYVWPRLGANAPLDAAAGRLLAAAGFVEPADLHALFMQPGGAAWWRAHGWGIDATFDLDDDSISMAVLSAYLEHKGYAL